MRVQIKQGKRGETAAIMRSESCRRIEAKEGKAEVARVGTREVF